ncbi:hypothetical protein DIPPA_23771 [Diplonema papillatum]|nr:hypothetical protein DIPPA_23771 [Diplonema papillatum]
MQPKTQLKNAARTQRNSFTRESGKFDEQLDNLRDAVRREREKRFATTERKPKPKEEGSVMRSSKLSRMTSCNNVRFAPSGSSAGLPTIPSEKLTEALHRVQAFDLFGGEVDTTAVTTNEAIPTTGLVDAVEKARQEHRERFQEIEQFQYDEEAEIRQFAQRMVHTQDNERTIQTEADPQPRASPSPPSNRKTPAARPVPGQKSARDGGIWDIYNPTVPSGSVLQKWKRDSSRAQKPQQQQHSGKAAETPKKDISEADQQELRRRMSALQTMILAPPPAGGDVAVHQQRQKRALEELQELQKRLQWGCQAPSAPAPKTSIAVQQTAATASAFDGSYDEVEARQQFQDAVAMWRDSGKPTPKVASSVSTSTADSTSSRAMRSFSKQFLLELSEATEFVYFEHLLQNAG